MAGLIAGLLAAALAGYYAAAAGAAALIGGRSPGALLAALPGCWLLAELLRGKLFTGFGWLAAGYSQVPASPLAGLVPVLGLTGTTGAAAAVAAGLAAAAVLGTVRLRALGLAAAVLPMFAGILLRSHEWTEPAGPPVSVSILQAAIPQEEQWRRDNLAEIPRRYIEMAEHSAGRLIIAPEGAVPGVLPRMHPEIIAASLAEVARERDGSVLIGAFGYDAQRDRHTNSAFAVAADGIAAEYRKRKLTPYGEYLPFGDLLEPILERARIPFSRLVPGAAASGSMDLGFVELGMTICYEDAFPELLRTNKAPVLANLTNDSWFDGTAMPDQHLQIAAARALEAGRWLVRASNTGPSAAIGPDGRVQRLLEAGVRGILEAEVVPRTGRTPYSGYGDAAALALAALALLLGLGLRAFIKIRP